MKFLLIFITLFLICQGFQEFKREPEIVQNGYFRQFDPRPVPFQTRSARIRCMMNLQSFQLCQNVQENF
ncbi:unnamed protein product [Caenorhabditis angaria]|uniref:Uncharacterized protein n=1 Tax=Caenorhabditis angaria TaxID=860376 RepID=A0A9P1IMX2_9PELO|nr:unnamed protein product [Caenorhabditis angaria]